MLPMLVCSDRLSTIHLHVLPCSNSAAGITKPTKACIVSLVLNTIQQLSIGQMMSQIINAEQLHRHACTCHPVLVAITDVAHSVMSCCASPSKYPDVSGTVFMRSVVQCTHMWWAVMVLQIAAWPEPPGGTVCSQYVIC